MPKRTCTQCGRTIQSGSRCAAHPARWANGSTTAWRKLRANVLLNQPRCWCGQPATEVHHLHPGSSRIVSTNELQAVCHTHNPRGG